MPGAELIGPAELDEIRELFSGDKVNLYRYDPGNHKTRELESLFASAMGVRFAHAVSSGTAAIHCALAAAGVGPGDEVITTAFTFVAPVEAICALGAVPVPVEIDETFHLDPEAVERAVSEKTKAVVAVPMWAAPDMKRISELCRRHGLVLIEDAAQALGGRYRGELLGTIGDIGSFSFDAGKTLHTGEGGIVITDDEELYNRAAEFSDHGHMHVDGLPRGRDPRRVRGLNYRMSELTAAVGVAQVKRMEEILERSRRNKRMVKEQIIHLPGLAFRKFHDEEGAQGDTLIFSLENRQAALSFEAVLMERGIGTKILPEAFEWHFAGSWGHLLPDYERYRERNLDDLWPATRALLERSICLNIPVLLDEEKATQLVQGITAAAGEW